MSDQQDKQETAQLADVSDELTRSLRLCHSLVDDYRIKLAANSNEACPETESRNDPSGPR